MSVISENAFHVAQSVFFTTLLKEDVVSHPVNAWKKGSALKFSCPRFFFFCNRMYCNISIVLLDPQSNPNFAKRQSMKRGNPKDYNVSIHRSNQNSAITMLCTIKSMKDKPGVSFFVITWSYISSYFTVAVCNNINTLS